MAKKEIQTNVIIAEKEELFFKEVVFDFDSLPPQTGLMGQSPNLASRLFIIQNIDESIEVKAYPTRDRAIMFNAWIIKNISYKIAAQGTKDPNPFPFPIPTPSVETVGMGMKDTAGYPTVYGPIYHMTKVIDFGGFIKLDLPSEEKLNDTDIVEVLSAEIVGTHDELLNPEPIYEPYSSKIMVPLPPDPNDPPGTPPKFIESVLTKYKQFDPQLTQYARLREKMCIKIRVRVVRGENVNIDCQN
ncbi:MAG: hypothetical protein ACREV6_15205 [Clostridium sp.]|uniref:hypothetical protein n=1 Tax=Clostridium sp. TaxID=1506 RepID=UPI003D6D08AE